MITKDQKLSPKCGGWVIMCVARSITDDDMKEFGLLKKLFERAFKIITFVFMVKTNFYLLKGIGSLNRLSD